MSKITNSARHAMWRDVMAQITDREGTREISDDVAAAIAAGYQSPGTVGHVLASLASGVTVEHTDLLDDIAATYRTVARSDRFPLDMLSTWTLDRTAAGTRDYVSPSYDGLSDLH
jgi:hypothetical protein